MRRKTALTSKTRRYPREKLYLCTDRTHHASRLQDQRTRVGRFF